MIGVHSEISESKYPKPKTFCFYTFQFKSGSLFYLICFKIFIVKQYDLYNFVPASGGTGRTLGNMKQKKLPILCFFPFNVKTFQFRFNVASNYFNFFSLLWIFFAPGGSPVSGKPRFQPRPKKIPDFLSCPSCVDFLTVFVRGGVNREIREKCEDAACLESLFNGRESFLEILFNGCCPPR